MQYDRGGKDLLALNWGAVITPLPFLLSPVLRGVPSSR